MSALREAVALAATCSWISASATTDSVPGSGGVSIQPTPAALMAAMGASAASGASPDPASTECAGVSGDSASARSIGVSLAATSVGGCFEGVCRHLERAFGQRGQVDLARVSGRSDQRWLDRRWLDWRWLDRRLRLDRRRLEQRRLEPSRWFVQRRLGSRRERSYDHGFYGRARGDGVSRRTRGALGRHVHRLFDHGPHDRVHVVELRAEARVHGSYARARFRGPHARARVHGVDGLVRRGERAASVGRSLRLRLQRAPWASSACVNGLARAGCMNGLACAGCVNGLACAGVGAIGCTTELTCAGIGAGGTTALAACAGVAATGASNAGSVTGRP